MTEAVERVHTESDWWDGPRGGLADVDGVPHYFQAVEDDPGGQYVVWPVNETALAWEREQWAIFVDWITRFEAGEATTDSHPGKGGVHARYDELTILLYPDRKVPADARRMSARWHPRGLPSRYNLEGPNYLVTWIR